MYETTGDSGCGTWRRVFGARHAIFSKHAINDASSSLRTIKQCYCLPCFLTILFEGCQRRNVVDECELVEVVELTQRKIEGKFHD